MLILIFKKSRADLPIEYMSLVFLFKFKFKNKYISYESQILGLFYTFQVFNHHVLLLSTSPHGTNIKLYHHGRKFYQCSSRDYCLRKSKVLFSEISFGFSYLVLFNQSLSNITLFFMCLS